MKKTIELTDNKAIRVEPVLINGKPYVSIRQMYKSRNNPEWQHSRQGINLDLEAIADVVKYVNKYAEADQSEFTVLEFDKKGRGDDEDTPPAKKAGRKAKQPTAPWEDEDEPKTKKVSAAKKKARIRTGD